MVEKIKIVNNVLSLILVAFFVGGLVISHHSLSEKQDEVEKEMDRLDRNLDYLNRQSNQILSNSNSNSMQLAKLWKGTLDPENYAKIDSWEKNNSEFVYCKKTFRNLAVKDVHYTYDAKPGNLLVYMFKNGDLIYEKNGDIYCYFEPDDMNPPRVDCMKLCEDEELDICCMTSSGNTTDNFWIKEKNCTEINGTIVKDSVCKNDK